MPVAASTRRIATVVSAVPGRDQRPLQDLQVRRAAGAHDQPGARSSRAQRIDAAVVVHRRHVTSLHRGQHLDARAVGERRARPPRPRARPRRPPRPPRRSAAAPARRARRARRAPSASSRGFAVDPHLTRATSSRAAGTKRAGSAARTGPGTGSPRSRASTASAVIGREQHPVAVVAGGDEQPVRAERADQRQVVRAARAAAPPRSPPARTRRSRAGPARRRAAGRAPRRR